MSHIINHWEMVNFNGTSILHTTQIPSTHISSVPNFINFDDKESITKIACRRRTEEPIWSLICDLNKTTGIQIN